MLLDLNLHFHSFNFFSHFYRFTLCFTQSGQLQLFIIYLTYFNNVTMLTAYSSYIIRPGNCKYLYAALNLHITKDLCYDCKIFKWLVGDNH